MPRYFIEVRYKGTRYAGFQVQKNANTIQAEIEKVLAIYFRNIFSLTCSSRTDAGVHALQNFLHVDTNGFPSDELIQKAIYNLNAILPLDIVITNIFKVDEKLHCRFDALQREYKYYIYQQKDPFRQTRAYYYPYNLDIQLLQKAAEEIMHYQDFTSFSKRNTQVNNFICQINQSSWEQNGFEFVYSVKANRFLRGMVRGLVGTMLRVGTGKISMPDFIEILKSKNASKTDFSVPPQGLFLVKVDYPQ